jgi:hypothetical protein
VQVVHTRLNVELIEALDGIALAYGISRGAAVRMMLGKALAMEGAPGGSSPLPAADAEMAWPHSEEVTIEAVRRRLWEQSSAGSVGATAALERSLARDHQDDAEKANDGGKQSSVSDEIDALAEQKRRKRRSA